MSSNCWSLHYTGQISHLNLVFIWLPKSSLRPNGKALVHTTTNSGVCFLLGKWISFSLSHTCNKMNNIFLCWTLPLNHSFYTWLWLSKQVHTLSLCSCSLSFLLLIWRINIGYGIFWPFGAYGCCMHWFNPLHPKIGLNILHTVLYTFPKVLTRRICLPIKRFLPWWPFPLFSWPWRVIQDWYCWEKLHASRS